MNHVFLALIFLGVLISLDVPRSFAAATVEQGPVSSSAAAGQGSGREGDEVSPPQDSGNLAALQEYVSAKVEALSWRIDSFFGATRVYEEYRGNYVQLRGSVLFGKGGAIDYDGGLRAKFDLPNLTDKVNLLIESEADNQPQDNRITTGTGNTLTDTVNNKDLNASLQIILQQMERWDLRLQPGLKVKLPLDPFVRLRFRYLNPVSENWLTRLTLTPGWYNSRGWEARARYDFEGVMGIDSLFRSSSEAVWLLDESRNLGLTQAFLFAHALSNKDQMAYEGGVNFEIDPEFQDTGYFASVRYRRDIHDGWIFMEVKPQILLTRDDDFKPDVSLAFTLEVLFGRQYQYPNWVADATDVGRLK